ncbi:hypothetical protein FACS1894162_6990 [Bacteroidia bacterium]|nr:hypothetical protein FACS1894162_6990 [Bacteroidia bacterium]
MKLKLSVILFLTVLFNVQAAVVSTKNIDWQKFLAGQNLIWDSIPANYYAGSIMGNGLLGTNFYKLSDNNYRLDVGRTDVTEGRNEMDLYKNESQLYTAARLPIGYFQLTTLGNVTEEKMRLSLYDATTSGHLKTDKGNLDFKTYVHSTQNYIVFETDADTDKKMYEWKFVPLTAISPRYVANSSDKDQQINYNANPNPEVKIKKDDYYHLAIQNLVCGKTYVVAWAELPLKIKRNNKHRIIATIAQENSEVEAIAVAKKTIYKAFNSTYKQSEETHTDWWHNYYPASYVSFPDAKLEQFYWRQIYKFACVTRQDKLIADLQGPWAMQKTPWPAVWFNLNTQLTYSWQYTANRSELTEPLWKALQDNVDNLTKNVTDIPRQELWMDAINLGRSGTYNLYRPLNPDLVAVHQYEVGNLTWILYYYWQYCVYNNKTDELQTQFFDLLKRAVNYYFHIRTKMDGVYHLPPTSSPEYGVSPADCNYDLALLKWGLQTLINIDTQYNINDAKKADWQDFLNNLTDYPVSETRGFNLGANSEFKASHRHYSHLLMIYPLYTVNWEQPENREVITKSVDNWQSMKQWLQGYSFTGSAAMYASMGDGDKALTQLQTLLKKFIQPNTLYKESGPVLETPLAAVASLHDLYLQSWGGKIRIFPAMPTDWKDGSFIDLRTEGAFLVSATRKNGVTTFIQVRSEAGRLCRLQTGMDLNVIKVNKPYKVLDAETGLIEFQTKIGDIIQIATVK